MSDTSNTTDAGAAQVQSGATQGGRDMALRIAAELPYLRRYARALTGSQTSGDRYAAATLEAILADRSMLATDESARIALFRAFHAVWQTTGSPVSEPGDAGAFADGPEARAQAYLARLTPNTREALLLRTVEEFGHEEIARIMQIDPSEAEELVAIAYQEMDASIRGKVMVIEDEPLIAMDIEQMVESLGHRVVGTARTHKEATALFKSTQPKMVLADIQLADGSSGIDAVNEILAMVSVPVIFITAFPERLLTGERPEPTFLVTKPFNPDMVKALISQALFFERQAHAAA